MPFVSATRVEVAAAKLGHAMVQMAGQRLSWLHNDEFRLVNLVRKSREGGERGLGRGRKNPGTGPAGWKEQIAHGLAAGRLDYLKFLLSPKVPIV